MAICAGAATAACNKIPGLSKGDADGGSSQGSGSGGGILSFLGGNFEGELTMQLTNHEGGKPATPKTLVFGLKSPKVRIDVPADIAPGNPMLGGGAGVVIDPPQKKAYALLPAQKKAIVIDFSKPKEQRLPQLPSMPSQPGKPSMPSTPPEPPKVEKTGKKDVIAGYECDEWKITSKTNRADVCVAEGIKWIDLTDLGMESPELALAAAMSDVNRFPLRAVVYDQNNVETTRMVATKIDKKKLDDARFVVPPDYQVVDLAAMFSAFAGAGAGAPGAAGAGLPPTFHSGKLPPGFPPPKRAH
ncbi:hypothetical protein AKJ09_06203 [Labilithrix luteola]|uniref:DUF4412 domain-containing protein n=1 Tax=Labilithrix luteola TaxID=1391654 RepID=A0A0K1Q2C7_9BACT|nr:hypothetical protein AKJ09_06203 [Labilithrix luteola]